MLERQAQFRLAADAVTAALTGVPEVEAVALILAPDWEPVVWTEADRKKGQAWGLKTIETFHTHGTPPALKREH